MSCLSFWGLCGFSHPLSHPLGMGGLRAAIKIDSLGFGLLVPRNSPDPKHYSYLAFSLLDGLKICCLLLLQFLLEPVSLLCHL